MSTTIIFKGGSSESVKSGLVVQRDSLRSPELFCDVIEGATLCLWKAKQGEGEGEHSHGHKEEVDVRTAEFLFGQQTNAQILLLLLLLLGAVVQNNSNITPHLVLKHD